MNSKNGKDFRILTIDGGGSKGIYSLGVLKEVEFMIQKPIWQEFDLIYGTSTGAMIAALLGIGTSVEDITQLYMSGIPYIMRGGSMKKRTKKLKEKVKEYFGDRKFNDFKTGIGIVSINYDLEQPMIFKSSVKQAHGSKSSFKPGFGCFIWEAVLSSSAAFPFFEKARVKTENQGEPELIDGGFIANNPTLFAIADALNAFKIPKENIRILNVGVGSFIERPTNFFHWVINRSWPLQLTSKVLASNSAAMARLRQFLFGDIPCIRISDSFTGEDFKTNFLEHDPEKLSKIRSLGRKSFGDFEEDLKKTFGWSEKEEENKTSQ